jgi:DNA-binding NarL/FixJ family response regulator
MRLAPARNSADPASARSITVLLLDGGALLAGQASESMTIAELLALMRGADAQPGALSADRATQGDPTSAADSYAGLTAREREVLALIGAGLSNAHVATRLALSPHTVHRHRTSMMRKLGLHDRVAVLRYCIRRGLVDPLG